LQLHNKNHTRVREACQETLRALRLDYLDAYLMHWPFATDDQLNVLPGPPIEVPLNNFLCSDLMHWPFTPNEQLSPILGPSERHLSYVILRPICSLQFCL
jgi:diketogulonate reductase-like aldo/keto reductase